MADTKSALTTAIENQRKAQESSNAAAAAVRVAQAARDGLIADAAAGKPVKAQDVREAEEKTRSAEIEAEIARNIHAKSVELRHEAQVAAWHDEARALKAAYDIAVTAREEAYAAVLEGKSKLQALVRVHNDAVSAVRDALDQARIFNGDRPAKRITNPILAANLQDAPYVAGIFEGGPNVSPGKRLEVLIERPQPWPYG